MPLRPQRLSFPVNSGQAEDASAELIDPPRLLSAVNWVFDRDGDLTKRRGWQYAEENSDILPICEKLAVRENEVLWIGEKRDDALNTGPRHTIYSRVQAETLEDNIPFSWIARSSDLPNFTTGKILTIPGTNPERRISGIDIAFAGSAFGSTGAKGVLLSVFRYLSTGVIEYVAVDIATRSVLARGTLHSGTAPSGVTPTLRVVGARHADGDWYFHVFYATGTWEFGWGNISYRLIPAARPWIMGEETVLMSNCTSFDACVTDIESTSEQRVFICRTIVAQDRVDGILSVCDNDGVISFETVTGQPLIVGGFSLTPYSNTIHVACSPNGRHLAYHIVAGLTTCAGSPRNVFGIFDAGAPSDFSLTARDLYQIADAATSTSHDPAGVQVGWAGTLDVSGDERWDNFWCTYVSENNAVDGMRSLLFRAQAAGALIPDSSTRVRPVSPFGRMFLHRGQTYIPCVRGKSIDAIGVEVQRLIPQSGDAASYPVPAARALFGEIAFPDTPNIQFVRGKNAVVESVYERGRFFSVFAVLQPGDISSSVSIVELDTRDPQLHGWCEIDGGTYFSGSIPWCHDGARGHELGYVHRPQSIRSADGEIFAEAVAGTPALAEGDYQVAMCWESTDSLGRTSRSAPSYSTTVTVAAGEQLSVTYEPLGRTSHQSTVRPVVYVSNDDGLNYVRSQQVLTHVPTGTDEITVVLNSPQLFQDNMPKLYASNGIIESAQPPAIRFICAWQGRLWGASESTIWYTREIISGEEPTFADAQSFNFHGCTGIASLDDRLVIFRSESIHWISGDGPTDTGEGGTFTLPQRVFSSVGCIDARSILRTERGICFQSRRGIELLMPDMSTALVSGGIEKMMRVDGYSEVISASLDPDAQIARFILRKGALEHVVACWHTASSNWTTMSIPRVASEESTASIPTGIVHSGRRNWIAEHPAESDPPSYLLREVRASEDQGQGYLDGPVGSGYWYQSTVVTANVKLEALQGFSRVWRVYALVKDRSQYTGIQLNYAIDYGNESSNPRSWTSVELGDIESGNIGNGTHYRYAIHLDQQRCSAVRLTLRDLQYTADPEPPTTQTRLTVVGFGLEYGTERGTGRGSERSKQ